MAISKDNVVEIHYTLKNNNGDLIDTSEGKDPLGFIYGSGAIIPGLETALEEKSEGESFSVSIPPEEAYGTRNPEMVQTVPLEQFEDQSTVEVGAQFHIPEQGLFATVMEISDTEAKLDMNHPLVDETLHFDVTVKTVREATKEELEQGSTEAPAE